MPPRHGAIAAGHSLTAEAGEIVLRDGGNAFDAAIAALATACVVEPALASLGGGGFATVRPVFQKTRVIDFFAHTPAKKCAEHELDFESITVDFGSATQEFHVGLGSSAVPGVLAGLFEIHRHLATIPMRELLAPAIAHARNGVVLSAFQAHTIRILTGIFTAKSEINAIFRSPEDGERLVGEKELLRQPDLASALEAIAYEGSDLFYHGEMGQRLASDMATGGGHLSLQDLADYEVVVRDPVETRYRNWLVQTNPPPSSGGTLIAFALQLLSSDERETHAFASPGHLYRLIQVMECTSAARLEAAAKEDGLTPQTLLDPDFVQVWRDRIAAHPKAYRGTTHISVIDSKGNAAATTLSNGEGSAYVIPGTGIAINNMLGEEDLNPGGFHQWATDTRLTSMMAPSLVVGDDAKLVAIGSGGSNRIRSAIMQVISNLIDHAMDCEQAVGNPRIHFENGVLSVEGGFDLERIAPVLEAYPRHQLFASSNLFFGGAHVVMSDGNGFQGAGDHRRDGVFLIA